MTVAYKLKQPLSIILETYTELEVEMWLAWFAEKDNTPTPLMYYLMQIAKEVRSVLSKKPEEIKLEHFKIQFTRELNLPLTKKQEDEAKKSFSRAMLAHLRVLTKSKPRPSKTPKGK